MGCPDHEKPRSIFFSLFRNLYASISFPLKHSPYHTLNEIENFLIAEKEKHYKQKKSQQNSKVINGTKDRAKQQIGFIHYSSYGFIN